MFKRIMFSVLGALLPFSVAMVPAKAATSGSTEPTWQMVGKTPPQGNDIGGNYATEADTVTVLNNTLYAGTTYGAYKFVQGSWKLVGDMYLDGTTERNPDYSLSIIKFEVIDGVLYASTNDGLYRLSKNLWIAASPHRLGQNMTDPVPDVISVGGILYDTISTGGLSGTVAVFSYSHGSWHQLGSIPYQNNDKYGNQNTINCFAYLKGVLYAGGDDGVYAYSHGHWSLVGSSAFLSKNPGNDLSNMVVSLTEANGKLYAGTFSGVYCDNNGSWGSVGDSTNMPLATLISVNGVLIAGSGQNGTGVYEYRNGSWQNVGSLNHQVYGLTYSKGMLYAATDDGVYSLSLSQYKFDQTSSQNTSSSKSNQSSSSNSSQSSSSNGSGQSNESQPPQTYPVQAIGIEGVSGTVDFQNSQGQTQTVAFGTDGFGDLSLPNNSNLSDWKAVKLTVNYPEDYSSSGGAIFGDASAQSVPWSQLTTTFQNNTFIVRPEDAYSAQLSPSPNKNGYISFSNVNSPQNAFCVSFGNDGKTTVPILFNPDGSQWQVTVTFFSEVPESVSAGNGFTTQMQGNNFILTANNGFNWFNP